MSAENFQSGRLYFSDKLRESDLIFLLRSKKYLLKTLLQQAFHADE